MEVLTYVCSGKTRFVDSNSECSAAGLRLEHLANVVARYNISVFERRQTTRRGIAMWRFSGPLARILLPAAFRDDVSVWSGAGILTAGMQLLALYFLTTSLPSVVSIALAHVMPRDGSTFSDLSMFAAVAWLEHVLRAVLGLILLLAAPRIVQRISPARDESVPLGQESPERNG